jgi:hypothetical protein
LTKHSIRVSDPQCFSADPDPFFSNCKSRSGSRSGSTAGYRSLQ